MAMIFPLLASKKGIFFSFISIFILLALFMLFSNALSSDTSSFLDESEHEQISIASSNILFFKDNYLENMLIFSFRDAVSSYLSESDSRGEMIIDCMQPTMCGDDSELLRDLVEMLKWNMATGQIVEDPSQFSPSSMESVNLSESRNIISYINGIRDIFYDDFQINITFLDSDGNPWPEDDGIIYPDRDFIESEIVDEITVEQDMAFSISLEFTISFDVSVRDGSASWSYRDVDISVDVPLSGLVDPLYMMGTRDTFGDDMQFNNTIREDSRSARDNMESIVALYDDMRYVAASGLGPSFLQRMINSPHTSECCGMESLVNINRMFGSDVDDEVMPDDWFLRSNVDHQYFYHDTPPGENVFSCEEIPGQGDLQLLFFAQLREDDNPMFFNLDTFYAENYNFNQLLGSQLCQFSNECVEDEDCDPEEDEEEDE